MERQIINKVYGLTYRSKNVISNETISNLFELLIVNGAIKCNKEDNSVNIRYIVGKNLQKKE